MAKITYIARVVLKGKSVPDFGLGKGIVSEQEVTFNDKNNRGEKSPLLMAAKLEQADRMLNEVAEVTFERKK